jgi:protoporphyrinogen oxidase
LTRHQKLALAGNAYGGVGMADCIHSGESAAEALLDEIKRSQKQTKNS